MTSQTNLLSKQQTSSAELGVGTPIVSGSLNVASPAKPDNTAKIISVPILNKNKLNLQLLVELGIPNTDVWYQKAKDTLTTDM